MWLAPGITAEVPPALKQQHTEVLLRLVDAAASRHVVEQFQVMKVRAIDSGDMPGSFIN
jgi:hypothetical protein